MRGPMTFDGPGEFYDGVMKDYYPGSKTPVQPYDERPAPEPVDIGDPHIYPIKGVPTEFYTTGQLAAVLGRKANTIRSWELNGVIPKARYTRPGKEGDVRGQRRLYTRAQVEGIAAIAEAEGIMDLAKSIKSTAFTAKVVALFKTLEGIK